ncbi:hypothetical protein CWI84_02160 [Idiomarina tyrosinivorans]|uniref:N-acetyltransferase domain-containing protein n=1 Tax=Idiomarina tyrosinivorans TaxID=1445662 RepID=A0A432ZSS7_9GAMM|nr:hypothetical protein [Idiomarina tyrosinivorans]RUO80939.1 hypothetical protein CWI84_02160 [Idiomarina tyrosinivorans]
MNSRRPMEKLHCRGVDGVIREYSVSISNCVNDIWIEVEASDTGAGKLEMVLEPQGEMLWLKYIERSDTEAFVGKGVAEAIIVESARYFKKQLISTYHASDDYGRSESATKMWQRLVANGLAKHDESSDRFVTSITIPL